MVQMCTLSLGIYDLASSCPSRQGRRTQTGYCGQACGLCFFKPTEPMQADTRLDVGAVRSDLQSSWAAPVGYEQTPPFCMYDSSMRLVGSKYGNHSQTGRASKGIHFYGGPCI